MSYQVLARKWRPRLFREMVGQTHVLQALINALDHNRLHHAYLFTGTRGVGKTTIARILAKCLNCEAGVSSEPCGVCSACREIDEGRFVDLIEVDAASRTKVEDTRELLDNVQYAPTRGRFKVYLIDEVHMLSSHSFNALLKTLEEPPAHVKFLLATTDPQKLPVTILSRCLQFSLKNMLPEKVVEHLRHVLAEEQVPFDEESLWLLGRAADGSMRDGLSLTDQAIAFGGGQLQEATVRQMLGAVDRGYVLRLIDALARGDGAAVVDTVDELRLNGLNAASLLEEMTGVLQRMAVLQAVPARAAQGEASTDPDETEIARLALLQPADETQLLYSLCLHGRAELGLAPDEYAALTMVLLRLLAFKPAGATVAGTSAAVEKKTPLNPPPGRETAPAPVPAPAPRVAVAVPAPVVPAPAVAPVPRPEPRAEAVAVPTNPPAAEARPVPPQPPAERLPPPDMPKIEDYDDGPPWVDEDMAAVAPSAPVPPRVVAIPVRDPGLPSERVEPRRSDVGAGPDPSRLVPTPEGDFWHDTVMRLVQAEAITALVRELGLQSQLVARSEGLWTLRIERSSLAQGATGNRLAAALATLGHEGVKIATDVVAPGQVTDSPALRLAAEARRRQREAENLILADPFVQAMMRDFGGTIVPGSLKADAA